MGPKAWLEAPTRLLSRKSAPDCLRRARSALRADRKAAGPFLATSRTSTRLAPVPKRKLVRRVLVKLGKIVNYFPIYLSAPTIKHSKLQKQTSKSFVPLY